MSEIWGLLDTGLGSPAHTVALSCALLEARRANEIPNALHFARSTRCVMVGALESLGHVVDVQYCRVHEIPVQRRVTNGRAVYVDKGQLLWALCLHRRGIADQALGALKGRICHAAAAAIAAFGIDARPRGNAEIEVDGRAIGSVEASIDGEALLIQGMLRIGIDPLAGLDALRFPGKTLTRDEALAGTRRRVTNLRTLVQREPEIRRVKHNLVEAFESEFDVEFRESDLSLSEAERYRRALRQVSTAVWIENFGSARADVQVHDSHYDSGAGRVHAIVAYDRVRNTLQDVWFAGRLSWHPSRAVADLEAALRGTTLDRMDERLRWFFASRQVDLRGTTLEALASLLRRAVHQPLVGRRSEI